MPESYVRFHIGFCRCDAIGVTRVLGTRLTNGGGGAVQRRALANLPVNRWYLYTIVVSDENHGWINQLTMT